MHNITTSFNTNSDNNIIKLISKHIKTRSQQALALSGYEEADSGGALGGCRQG